MGRGVHLKIHNTAASTPNQHEQLSQYVAFRQPSSALALTSTITMNKKSSRTWEIRDDK